MQDKEKKYLLIPNNPNKFNAIEEFKKIKLSAGAIFLMDPKKAI